MPRAGRNWPRQQLHDLRLRGKRQDRNCDRGKGELELYSPWVHSITSTSSVSKLWIQNADTVADKWLKFGYREHPSNNRILTLEAKTGSGSTPIYIGTGYTWNPGGSPLYTLTYNTSTGVHTATTPGTSLGGVNLSMNIDLVQIVAETYSAADQLVGAVTNPAKILNANRQTGGSSWGSFSGNITYNTSPANHGLNGISTSEFDVWDKACSS